MVFTWVSTGAIEPFTPKPPWGFRVPSTHANQNPHQTDNDRSSLDNPTVFGSREFQPSPQIERKVRAYQESNTTKTSGDVLQFVYEIMTEDVDTLFDTDTLDDAKRKFRGKRYRHIPILDSHDKLIGIFSDRDMLRVIADEITMASLIRNYMVEKILTASPDTKIREAAFVMVTEKIGCLPIVNRERELVGILTRSDILKSITRKPPLELFA